MFERFYFENNDGDSIEFDVGEHYASNITMKSIQFEYQVRSNRRPKMQQIGAWPGYVYTGECLIHTEGDLLGRETSPLLTDLKMQLSSVIFGNPAEPIGGTLPDYPVGFVLIRPYGFSEDCRADVTLDGDITVVNRALYPSFAEFQITFVAFDGYFVGVDTNTPYRLK